MQEQKVKTLSSAEKIICETCKKYQQPSVDNTNQRGGFLQKRKIHPVFAGLYRPGMGWMLKIQITLLVTLSVCSAISGSSSATSACRGNRGVDVNLDDFMLSSVANDKKARIPLSYSGCCGNAMGCIQESAKKQQSAAFSALYPRTQLC